jgi:hypothetical protein
VAEPDPPPFAGKPARLLVFRVNRRPLTADNLFAEPGLPTDVFDHFLRVFAPGHPVVTGRAHQRTWRAGGLEVDHGARVLTGRLGWEPRREDVIPAWSDEDKDWSASRPSPQGGRLLPFGFDGETRLLTVLRDPKTSPSTLAYVFERILRDNEMGLLDRTTEWSVEPVLDRQDFISWLRRVDVVTEVSFTARLPNPDPRSGYEDVAQRLVERRATSLTETIRSDRDTGLRDIEEDPIVRKGLAMAEDSFATVSASAVTNGAVEKWNQKDRVASVPVSAMPGDWPEIRAILKGYLRDRLRRFLSDEAG